MSLTGTSAINGTGNTLDNNLTGNSAVNILTGGDGNDTLDGGTGADSMIGGQGDDTYIRDTGDVITENASEGTDTVFSSVGYTLAANVENLTLTGSTAINGNGNTLDNYLTGNSAANTLYGYAGNDTLIGGAGDDSLLGYDGNDQLDGGEGDDIIYGDDVYSGTGNDTLSGGEGDDKIYGGNGRDMLSGGEGNDIIYGGYGNDDTLSGGAGDDYLYDEEGSETYLFGRGDGADKIYNYGNYTLYTDTVVFGEGITLADLDREVTNGGWDLKIGIKGTTDSLTVYNQFYYSAQYHQYPLDQFRFADGTLMSAAQLEAHGCVVYGTSGDDKYLKGAGGPDMIFGYDGNDKLYGLAGNDTLDGGTGADNMIGGTGDDTYVRDNTGDVITENANEGTDTVQSSITYTLGNNVENLTLTGTSAINGTGNTLDNYLTGNSAANTLTGGDGNDTLNGGVGADSMIGGQGNDTYVVDNADDAVTENANEGTDTIQSSVTYTLAANIEGEYRRV